MANTGGNLTVHLLSHRREGMRGKVWGYPSFPVQGEGVSLKGV
jgi:hypothetical protein